MYSNFRRRLKAKHRRFQSKFLGHLTVVVILAVEEEVRKHGSQVAVLQILLQSDGGTITLKFMPHLIR